MHSAELHILFFIRYFQEDQIEVNLMKGTCSMRMTGRGSHIIVGTNKGFAKGRRNISLEYDLEIRYIYTRKNTKNFIISSYKLYICKIDMIGDECSCTDWDSNP